jgi:hypothetical protein
VRDLWDGAEAYLQMWERANGIRTPACAGARGAIRRRGRGPLRLGRRWPALLRAAGQPQQRGRAWSWCVRGGGADVAELTRRGRVELVGSTARGRRAGGVAVGTPKRDLRGTRRAAPGVRYRRTWVYRLRGGRVAAVATTTRSLARRPRALASAMRRLAAARARSTTSRFEPRAGAARLSGRPLAGTGDGKADAALALLCRLQVSALAG